jgi:prepilin-type N-terminal cleavage/methylation domain-containing protein
MIKSNNKAFTLVELSIVLVVVSLLISAVLSINKLRQVSLSQLIVSEQMNYRRALSEFYKLHNAIAGDFYDAWYQFADETVRTQPLTSLYLTQITGQATIDIDNSIAHSPPLNGNGDSKVSLDLIELNCASGIYYYSEVYAVWTHLSRSGILSDQYRVLPYNTQINSLPGYNIPKAKNLIGENIGYLFFYPGDTTAIFNKHHVLEIASFKTQNNLRGTAAAINGQVMQLIDSKFDDSKPLSGKIIASNDSQNICHNRSQNEVYDESAIYSKNTSGPQCIAIFTVEEF